ncbi:MAG: hypothetical protein J6A92_00800 [Lachnospiraceae bacterium]|nr:hypothetical protein [Lachnospiraceae bacterium]
MVLVTALQDSKSRRRKDENHGKQKSFGQLLADEKERQNAEHSFEGKTMGYARNGQVFVGQTMQRVYN